MLVTGINLKSISILPPCLRFQMDWSSPCLQSVLMIAYRQVCCRFRPNLQCASYQDEVEICCVCPTLEWRRERTQESMILTATSYIRPWLARDFFELHNLIETNWPVKQAWTYLNGIDKILYAISKTACCSLLSSHQAKLNRYAVSSPDFGVVGQRRLCACLHIHWQVNETDLLVLF